MRVVKPKKVSRAALPERPESGTRHRRHGRCLSQNSHPRSWSGNGGTDPVSSAQRAQRQSSRTGLRVSGLPTGSLSATGRQHIEDDFLKMNLQGCFGGQAFVLTGNYPYNISSQIFFKKCWNIRTWFPCCTGMIQKEVAERIAAGPGSKTYGILSVLIQAWYKVEYLFTVHEHVFNPPPKVKKCRHPHDAQWNARFRMRWEIVQASSENHVQSTTQDSTELHKADTRQRLSTDGGRII